MESPTPVRHWLWEKKEIQDCPSFKEGMDRSTVERYRREGVRFILEVGGELKLSAFPTLATATVYFQRFYMFHSFKEFQRHITALGCLFLAGKVEETPKKCRDLIQIARDKLSDHHFAYFGKDPREEVMSVERVLLQTVKFDLQVEHPYQFILKYAKIFKIDRPKTESMVQMAWTFVNDSLCTTLCLQWESEVIAIALMYLASRLSKVDITDWDGKKGIAEEKWWDSLVEDMSQELMEDICHQVLDLYSTSKVAKPPPPPVTTATSAPPTPKPSVASTPSTPTPTHTPQPPQLQQYQQQRQQPQQPQQHIQQQQVQQQTHGQPVQVIGTVAPSPVQPHAAPLPPSAYTLPPPPPPATVYSQYPPPPPGTNPTTPHSAPPYVTSVPPGYSYPLPPPGYAAPNAVPPQPPAPNYLPPSYPPQYHSQSSSGR